MTRFTRQYEATFGVYLEIDMKNERGHTDELEEKSWCIRTCWGYDLWTCRVQYSKG